MFNVLPQENHLISYSVLSLCEIGTPCMNLKKENDHGSSALNDGSSNSIYLLAERERNITSSIKITNLNYSGNLFSQSLSFIVSLSAGKGGGIFTTVLFQ